MTQYERTQYERNLATLRNVPVPLEVLDFEPILLPPLCIVRRAESGVRFRPSLDTYAQTHRNPLLGDAPKTHTITTHQCGECGAIYRMEVLCGDRLCVQCYPAKKRRTTGRYEMAIKAMARPRFMTLTKKARVLSKEYLDEFLDDLRRMRRRVDFIEHIHGGAGGIQIGEMDADGTTNLHFHCIIDGKYWKQADISRLWKQVTGDSSIVDIRAVKDSQHAINYLAGYAGSVARIYDKATGQPIQYTPFQRKLINDVFRGRRTLIMFGWCQGYRSEDMSQPEPVVCPACGAHDSMRLVDIEPGVELVMRLPRSAIAEAIDNGRR